MSGTKRLEQTPIDGPIPHDSNGFNNGNSNNAANGSRGHHAGRLGTGTKRASSKHGRRHLLRREHLWGVTITAVLLTLVSALLLGLRIEQLEAQKHALQNEVRSLNNQLDELAEQKQAHEARFTALLTNRLPGLAKMHFDKVIPLQQAHLRHIQFTKITRDGEQLYEVRLVLENTTSQPLDILAEVFLFDDSGVELVSARLEGEEGPLVLAKGETRPVNVEVQPARAGEPEFFMVRQYGQ